MKTRFIAGGIFLLLFAAAAGQAQNSGIGSFPFLGLSGARTTSADAPVADPPVLDESVLPEAPLPLDGALPALPRMAPDLALVTYLSLANRQLSELGSYSDATVIEADLPDSAQHGKFELRRSFHAPRTLAFAAVHFAGDSFVKTNIIARLLQSEVEHVQKGEGSRTAITGSNYKFIYKGNELLNGRLAYCYQVKPRAKRPGLFKGRILIDAATGHLRRAEGSMVKSPSFFIKKLEFVQDYGDFGSFSLPVHVHSVARTRIVGRAVVDIYHERYVAKTLAEVQSEDNSSGASGSSGSGSN